MTEQNIVDPEDIEEHRPLPTLSPSDIRTAEALEERGSGVWRYSDGRDTDLRRCPKSLERVAKARARTLARDHDQEAETDE